MEEQKFSSAKKGAFSDSSLEKGEKELRAIAKTH